MAADLRAISIDADDPDRLAQFWAGLLGHPRDGREVLPVDEAGFRLRFRPAGTPKSGQNRSHLEMTSASLEQQKQTVERALELGGRHVDVGQLPEEEHVVLADPEGNEFCVIEPGNRFLAGCGFLASLSCDGTREVGLFWSAALGWPLVWDQDQETAIQSPLGGPKIGWGGPPLMPGTSRLRFELAVRGDRPAEEDRLVALGATRTGPGRMADPDGHEFLLS
jgi:catechol 2,3-dioxygenase-like lactoylglutathione lyase family enzyme